MHPLPRGGTGLLLLFKGQGKGGSLLTLRTYSQLAGLLINFTGLVKYLLMHDAGSRTRALSLRAGTWCARVNRTRDRFFYENALTTKPHRRVCVCVLFLLFLFGFYFVCQLLRSMLLLLLLFSTTTTSSCLLFWMLLLFFFSMLLFSFSYYYLFLFLFLSVFVVIASDGKSIAVLVCFL